MGRVKYGILKISTPFFCILCILATLVHMPNAEGQAGGGSQGISVPGPVVDDGVAMPTRIYVLGNVVKENGAPAFGACIELGCRSSVTKAGLFDRPFFLSNRRRHPIQPAGSGLESGCHRSLWQEFGNDPL